MNYYELLAVFTKDFYTDQCSQEVPTLIMNYELMTVFTRGSYIDHEL